jgi:hypothetical protein
MAGAMKRAAGIFRQTRRGGLFSPAHAMTMPIRSRFFAGCAGCLLAVALTASAQTNYYGTNGTEYAIVGSLPGDQVFPAAAISTNGGFVVWQDNATDGDGWGVSARRLDSTLSGTLGTFRVNVIGAGNQENARVALLKDGGAVFAWQGGRPGYQHIYARFLTPTNTFLTTNDILVDTFTNNFQISPSIAVLNNGNVVVVWASENEAGSNSMQDVYGQLLSPKGLKVGGEFLVNQFISFNQRTPSVAALAGGGFVVTWVSEQQRILAPSLADNAAYATIAAAPKPSVDVYARRFSATAVAAGGEFLVNTAPSPCANPVAAPATDGGFLIAWGADDLNNPSNSWDIYARTFAAAGTPASSVFYVNSHLYGDQFAPQASSIGLDYLVTWTSLAQDGSREGVFGQFVHNNGALVGGEFLVNTTTAGQQMQPAVASDGLNQFLVVWTSFTGAPYNFDLFAQRYLNAVALMQAMPAPYVWAPFVMSNNIYQPRLVVSWAPLLGLSISNYEVYVDGTNTLMGLVSSNQWTMTSANGLATNSTHSFRVDYVTTAGLRSPLSPPASGKTWGGLSWGGIPYEWMAAYFGGYANGKYNTSLWPAFSAPLAAGGPALSQIFLSGGNPLDSSTWLHTALARTAEGMFLSWNTQPGATYQVQATADFTGWSNLGPPRFAAGTTDSIYVGGSPAGYYRVVLLR